MTALAAAHGADQLGNATALTDGYTAAFLGAAGIAVAGGLVAAVTLRRPQAPTADQDAVEKSDRDLIAA